VAVVDFRGWNWHWPQANQPVETGRTSENPPPFEEYVTGIAERLAVSGHALDDLRFHQHLSYDIDCNWKTYVDNYLEGYHVPHVHPELNKLLDYRSYVTETKQWHSMQFSPLESGDDLYGSGEALYYFMYPNTMLNILPGRLQTNRVLPLPNNRCRVEFDFFYTVSADSAKDEARRKRDLEFSDVVQDEDIQICVDVQRGLDSGSYTAGRLNPLRENALHHFQELLRSDYRTYSSSVGSNAAG
jgi:choline monooxygenase